MLAKGRLPTEYCSMARVVEINKIQKKRKKQILRRTTFQNCLRVQWCLSVRLYTQVTLCNKISGSLHCFSGLGGLKRRVSHPSAVHISKTIKMQEVLDVHSFLEFSSDSRKRKA